MRCLVTNIKGTWCCWCPVILIFGSKTCSNRQSDCVMAAARSRIRQLLALLLRGLTLSIKLEKQRWVHLSKLDRDDQAVYDCTCHLPSKARRTSMFKATTSLLKRSVLLALFDSVDVCQNRMNLRHISIKSETKTVFVKWQFRTVIVKLYVSWRN